MSFLTPLFLLGGLAIAGPILFHLIRRNTRERFTFSSLMFLRPEPPRVTRKSRLEDILLLLARCLLLALLVLAFARPFFRELVNPEQVGDSKLSSILLIDVSASMRRSGLWEKVLGKARSIIDQTKSAESLGIIAFGDETKMILSLDQWSKLPEESRLSFARDALGKLQPGWGGTHLGNALLTASELLEEAESKGPNRIVVLTDLQEGSRLDGLQGHEWPEGIQLSMERLLPDVSGNAGLHLAPEREYDANESRALRVRVVNSDDATQESFRVAWLEEGESNASAGYSLYLPAGHSRTIVAPRRPLGKSRTLALLGDEESYDDQLFIMPEKPENIRVRFVGKESSEDAEQMRFYLERAFSKTGLRLVDFLALAPEQLTGFQSDSSDRLLIVTETLPEQAVQEVRAFCEAGKTVLLVLKDNAIAPTLAGLADSGPVPLTEAEVDEYALLTRPDFDHPLMSPFDEPRFGDFTKIHFWRHRSFDSGRLPGCRVLLFFDDGSPALVDLPIGRWNLLVLTSGWHPEDSQLALSSKFVPLLYSIMDLGHSPAKVKRSNLVGKPIAVPIEGAEPVEIEGPMGPFVLSSGNKVFLAEQPGTYLTKGTNPVSFAVNLPPAESRTTPMPVERLEGLGLPATSGGGQEASLAQARRQALLDEEVEKRQQTWRWLILAAVILAVLETWIGGRTWRRPALVNQTEEAA